MSTLAVNTITNAAGGNTAQINGMTPTAQSLQGFRNRLINGNMVIDQRNNGASATVTGGAYTLDRWLAIRVGGTSTLTIQRSTVAPSGFNNSLSVTVGSGAVPATTEERSLNQRIEGFNAADLGFGTANAQAVTLSFWVRSSVTGTFGVVFGNSAFNRSLVSSYTVTAANTWEYKTVTVAGDTSGTWLSDNGTGISIYWDLGVGPTFSGSASSSWQASGFEGLTGGTKLSATTGATWQITGVQLEAGSVATPFERRPYGTELALCERYYHSNGGATSYVAQSTAYNAYVFPQKMRTAPSVTLTPSQGSVNTGTISNAGFNSVGTTVVTGVAVIASAEL